MRSRGARMSINFRHSSSCLDLYQLIADSYAEIIGKVKLDEVKQPVLASSVRQINSDGALNLAAIFPP